MTENDSRYYIEHLRLAQPYFPLSLAVSQSRPSSSPFPVSALHATICHCRSFRLVRSSPRLMSPAFIHPRTSCLFASTRRALPDSCSSEASLCNSCEASGNRSRSVESTTRMTALEAQSTTVRAVSADDTGICRQGVYGLCFAVVLRPTLPQRRLSANIE